ncbi:hypothetical protein [Rhodococcus jostii]|uniref:hypothetical protein n=1 Tax=Rhodococcus jostii TaxID=132919 RepID=UPI0036422C06
MPKDKRPYITVTLDMPDHPKYAGLNRAQKMLLIEGWIHCAKYLTDGVMDIKVWNKFGTNRDRISLLDCESVATNSDGTSVLFVDYLEHQSSRSEVEAKRNQARSAGQKGGRAKAAKASGTSSDPLSETLAPATDPLSDPSSGSVAEVEIEREVRRKEEKTSSSASPQKAKPASAKGTRLPADWTPSPDLVEAMENECPGLNLRGEHLVFADYWHGVAGARGVKADWDATWRNWMRKAYRENSGGRRLRQIGGQQNLTARELNIAQAERFKSNPNLELLRAAGLEPANLHALPGGQ